MDRGWGDSASIALDYATTPNAVKPPFRPELIREAGAGSRHSAEPSGLDAESNDVICFNTCMNHGDFDGHIATEDIV
jgi:hypothetical protein